MICTKETLSDVNGSLYWICAEYDNDELYFYSPKAFRTSVEAFEHMNKIQHKTLFSWLCDKLNLKLGKNKYKNIYVVKSSLSNFKIIGTSNEPKQVL